MELMIMDYFKGYCRRTTWSRLLSIPTSASHARKLLHANQSWCINLLVSKVIDAVENHVLFAVDMEKSLLHAFENSKVSGSPQHKNNLSFIQRYANKAKAK
ncbi:hypothetical protein K450DRAFT_263473 [Umbelopsis ramanniana AG]|uniref:Uncharacterized protein n=1 Tax=Umbelopsis ramanniana AG TaxID=1314678 RepID=A0AAD5DYN1_UMBRA|nr:uncharacterized protein K450DRAFT_263473 [Umbelopsis ramanniana AG]KAI8575068.1 hypothetical protein K450DRAFT_263473 [Umbelopsis ramanniana AG]